MTLKIKKEMLIKILKECIDKEVKPCFSSLASITSLSRNTVKSNYRKLLVGGERALQSKKASPIYETIKKDQEIIQNKLKLHGSIPKIYSFLKDAIYKGSSPPYSCAYLKLFCKKELSYNPRNSKVESTILYETLAGEQAQVDWKENLKMISKTGMEFVVNVFIYKLCFSRNTNLLLCLEKRQDIVFKSLVEAFVKTGGVPEQIVFDNMKTVVYDPSLKGGLKINRSFATFAKDFNFKVIACKPHRPQTKGKVESAAKIVDELKLYNHEFETLDELSEILQRIENNYNNRISDATNQKPFDIFYKYEKHLLQKLPNEKIVHEYKYSCATRKVLNTLQISFRNNFYSVPYEYVGKEVDVTISKDCKCITVTHNGNYVCKHQLVPQGVKKCHICDDEHFNGGYEVLYGTDAKFDMLEQVKKNLQVYKFYLDLQLKNIETKEGKNETNDSIT